jgi:predicted alpha/beta superfamily hydrolase
MGEKRGVLVRVPPSYQTGTARYPVLYLTDAEAQMAHTVATIAFLAREGRMPEMIVIGISNTDRTRDLTPTHFVGTTFGNTASSGGADRFLEFIETELIPTIESRYRTQPYRVFAGHSFGGLFALHALFSKPHLFNAWIAVSPSLTWDNRYIARRAAEFVKANPELNASLVFTIGDEELVKSEFEWLKKFFAKKAPKGLEVESYYFGDEDHGSVVLPSHHAALKKIFAPWRFTFNRGDDPKVLLPLATEHYARLSKRAGFDVPIPEATVNQIGYLLLQRSDFASAIEVFRRNTELYPKSANVYDSLGEALEKSGDRDAARVSYERAHAIGIESNDPNTAVYKANLERVTAK